MLIRLLKSGEFLPVGGTAAIARFKLVAPPGEAWRMRANSSTGSFRGRLVNKGASLTNLIVRHAATPTFGGTAGLESNSLTLSTTSITNADTWVMPWIEIFQTGTTTLNDTDAEIALFFGFPVQKLLVDFVRAGMPYAVGDDIAHPSANRVEVW